MTAPVTAIIAGDTAFYTHFDKLYPISDVRAWYEGKPDLIEDTMLRNTALQGAYLIMAARALGLDCGPMSGFNNKMVDDVFSKEQPINQTSYATSVTDRGKRCIRVCRGLILTKPVKLYDQRLSFFCLRLIISCLRTAVCCCTSNLTSLRR